MKQEIDPQTTPRASAFSMWMTSPMPMVTLTKTLDVGRLRRYAQRHGMKFNMLLCWCIIDTASRMKEFYLLPEKGKLYRYDSLAVNVIVENRNGGINSCDIPFAGDLGLFDKDYRRMTEKVSRDCESSFLEGSMIVGTSAMVQTELDSVTNQYTELFVNPMVMWGKYRRHRFKTTLPISFQFHHVQMDGGQAARFLEGLQKTINNL